MAILKSVEELIEEKREEMMETDSEITLEALHRNINRASQKINMDIFREEGIRGILMKAEGQEFVRLLYRYILLREPDEAGLISNVNALLQGTISKETMILQFQNSPEAKNLGVSQLIAVEEGTTEAVEKKVNNERTERTSVEVSCDMLLQASGYEFVKQLYHNILLREPDEAGYVHHLNLLLTNACTRVQLIEMFANSPEAVSKGVKVIGLEKRRTKDKLIGKCKRIPGVGYICRLISNVVFLSRKIASLYQSCQWLLWRCEKLERKSEALQAEKLNLATTCQKLEVQYEKVNVELQEERQALEQECRNLKMQYEILQLEKRAIQARYEMLGADVEKVIVQSQGCADYINVLQKNAELVAAQQKEDKALCDTFYVHYNEKLMPDSRDAVKGRALPYIARLGRWCDEYHLKREQLKFIDLGCGECEWIELLSENGYHAIGVDSNDAVRAKVEELGLNVQIIRNDAIQYLKECEDSSVDCISSFHMVEHMDFITIITLLKECYRVLKTGGMLIIETPNPQNILTASYYFYLDPTHIKPIPPELMQFYVEESGFELFDKLLLNPLNFEPYEYREDDPIKDIVFRFNMEQAYSIMAVKK